MASTEKIVKGEVNKTIKEDEKMKEKKKGGKKKTKKGYGGY